MPKKISELAVAGTLGFDDLVPVVQGGVTEKATVEQLRRFIGVRVSRTTTMTIVDLNATTWAQADFDTDSFWTANSRTLLTAPYSGFYQIGFTTRASSSNQNYNTFIRKNGSGHVNIHYGGAANGNFAGSVVEQCNPGDFYELGIDYAAGSTILCHTGWYMTMTFLGR